MHGLHWPDAVLSYVVVALAARTNAARSALNRSAERRWRAPSSARAVADRSLSHPVVWGPPLPLIHAGAVPMDGWVVHARSARDGESRLKGVGDLRRMLHRATFRNVDRLLARLDHAVGQFARTASRSNKFQPEHPTNGETNDQLHRDPSGKSLRVPRIGQVHEKHAPSWSSPRC